MIRILALLLLSASTWADDLFSFQTGTGRNVTGKINPHALLAGNIRLKAPDGRVLTLRKVRSEGPTWIGEVNGFDGSQAVITNAQGEITAHIVYGDVTLEITAGRLGHTMRQLSDADLPAVFDEVLAAPDARVKPPPPPPPPTGPAIQDVYVATSTTFRNSYGGTAGAESAVLNAVALANQAYINSKIDLTLRLVGIRHATYTDSGSLSTDLNRLSNRTDTHMDMVPVLADEAKADLVVLMVKNGDYCGIAYMNGQYGVTLRQCIGQHTFAHEVGHMQGADHNRANAWVLDSNPYGYGYRYCENGGFRSIMSYSCSGVTRINRFSSPSILYNGKPTGTPNDDNARRIRDTAHTVAARK